MRNTASYNLFPDAPTERRMARQLELMVRLLEPVMLLITAVIILVVVAALLLPVFRMSTALR